MLPLQKNKTAGLGGKEKRQFFSTSPTNQALKSLPGSEKFSRLWCTIIGNVPRFFLVAYHVHNNNIVSHPKAKSYPCFSVFVFGMTPMFIWAKLARTACFRLLSPLINILGCMHRSYYSSRSSQPTRCQKSINFVWISLLIYCPALWILLQLHKKMVG